MHAHALELGVAIPMSTVTHLQPRSHGEEMAGLGLHAEREERSSRSAKVRRCPRLGQRGHSTSAPPITEFDPQDRLRTIDGPLSGPLFLAPKGAKHPKLEDGEERALDEERR